MIPRLMCQAIILRKRVRSSLWRTGRLDYMGFASVLGGPGWA